MREDGPALTGAVGRYVDQSALQCMIHRVMCIIRTLIQHYPILDHYPPTDLERSTSGRSDCRSAQW